MPEPDADQLIVFSDLDGTLLDHDSYDYTPAQPSLERLHRLNVPLVLASSKTAAEMVPLRAELGLRACPMICENGSGVVLGNADAPADDGSYDRLRDALDRVPKDLRTCFEGFGDMGPARIADVTGLPLPAAKLAAERHFSEPGVWTGTDAQLDTFLSALQAHGVAARRGGRFLTLSFGATKADQMKLIVQQLNRTTVIALGDAPNDAEMLTAADYAIVLPNSQGHPVAIPADAAKPVVIKATYPGPTGWHDALSSLLTRLGVAE